MPCQRRARALNTPRIFRRSRRHRPVPPCRTSFGEPSTPTTRSLPPSKYLSLPGAPCDRLPLGCRSATRSRSPTTRLDCHVGHAQGGLSPHSASRPLLGAARDSRGSRAQPSTDTDQSHPTAGYGLATGILLWCAHAMPYCAIECLRTGVRGASPLIVLRPSPDVASRVTDCCICDHVSRVTTRH